MMIIRIFIFVVSLQVILVAEMRGSSAYVAIDDVLIEEGKCSKGEYIILILVLYLCIELLFFNILLLFCPEVLVCISMICYGKFRRICRNCMDLSIPSFFFVGMTGEPMKGIVISNSTCTLLSVL